MVTPVVPGLLSRRPQIGARARRWLTGTCAVALTVAYTVGMGAAALVVGATQDMPALSQLTDRNRPVSIRFLDRYGREVLERGGQTGPEIDAAALPAHVRGAIISIEDARFRRHIGVDAEAILRAALANAQAGRRVQGGSTLTQQLVKNVFLTPDKTYRRKIQEALLAVTLERTYTKDEVLELYLERVYFGAGLWGLGAAAEGYFEKAPDELTLSEAVLLAGLLRAPSRTNPLTDPTRAGQRAALVLRKMEEARLIGDTERRDALRTAVAVRPPASALGTNYFADWIWPELESRLGIITTDIDIHTTLDADIQIASEVAVLAHLDADMGAEQAATVTLDSNGDVLAMVGGRSYAESQFNRATQSRRQPGSAFKPFVYLSALEAGYSPWDVMLDAPISVEGWTAENYRSEHLGSVTLREAFSKSLNTVAVRLAEDVGRDRVVSVAARFGLNVRPFPSVSLGAQAATPVEIAGAYQPFGSWGERTPPRGLRFISTREGTPLYIAPEPVPTRAVAMGPLRDLNYLLMRSVTQGTGRRARIPGRDIGGKTGTTNAFRDAWFAGVAPGLATAVWVGNDANAPMQDVTGGTIPAAIFADIMTAALQDRPASELPATPEPIWAEVEEPALEDLLAALEEALP